MSKVTLTPAEIIALKTCINYDNRECQLSDNFSNGGPDEFKAALGWNGQQVGGLIASLTTKEMGVMDEEDAEIFWLTKFGVHTIFDLIESEKAAA